MSGAEREGYEPWAKLAFALVLLTAVLVVYLGARPGGAGPVWVHGTGTVVLGLAGAVTLAGKIYVAGGIVGGHGAHADSKRLRVASACAFRPWASNACTNPLSAKPFS